MRHLIIGALLVVVALVVTSTASTLIERWAIARNPQTSEPFQLPTAKAPPVKGKPGETGRQIASFAARSFHNRNDKDKD
jgi:hypothetical protein